MTCWRQIGRICRSFGAETHCVKTEYAIRTTYYILAYIVWIRKP
jgi:hypothetical protein